MKRSALKQLKKLALAGLLFSGAGAHAGLHLEGFAGAGFLYSGNGALSKIPFEEGLSDEAGSPLNRLHTQYKGGGRIGWSKLGLAFGLDLSASLLREKEGGSHWMILPGAFVSYKLPLFFRIYGSLTPYGFLLMGQDYIRAAALSAGLRLFSLPFVSLNAEGQAARLFGAQANVNLYSLAAVLSVSL